MIARQPMNALNWFLIWLYRSTVCQGQGQNNRVFCTESCAYTFATTSVLSAANQTRIHFVSTAKRISSWTMSSTGTFTGFHADKNSSKWVAFFSHERSWNFSHSFCDEMKNCNYKCHEKLTGEKSSRDEEMFCSYRTGKSERDELSESGRGIVTNDVSCHPSFIMLRIQHPQLLSLFFMQKQTWHILYKIIFNVVRLQTMQNRDLSSLSYKEIKIFVSAWIRNKNTRKIDTKLVKLEEFYTTKFQMKFWVWIKKRGFLS